MSIESAKPAVLELIWLAAILTPETARSVDERTTGKRKELPAHRMIPARRNEGVNKVREIQTERHDEQVNCPFLTPTESSRRSTRERPAVRGLARRIERHQKAVRQGHCTVVDHGFEIGRLLLRAKERVRKRCFQKFLTRSFGAGTTAVSVRMCERYMKIAETLREVLDLALDDFDLPNATRVSQMPAFQALGLTSLRQILAISCEVDNTNETRTESPPQVAAAHQWSPDRPASKTRRNRHCDS